MKPNFNIKDTITNDNKATNVFYKFLNFLNGIINGELDTVETDQNITNIKYGIMYLLDTTGANKTADLPDLTKQNKTKWVFIKNTGTNLLTIGTFGSETIDGDTNLVLSANVYVTLMSTKTNWFIIGA